MNPSQYKEEDNYAVTHQWRWESSRHWLCEAHRLAAPGVILEVGGGSAFSQQLKEIWPYTDISHTKFDIRFSDKWLTLPTNHFDLVVNMEVIEHLQDLPFDGQYYDAVGTYSGVNACLRGCLGALRPGGLMFLTTPNTSSTACLFHWSRHAPLFTWTPHIRELGFKEAVGLVKNAGFEIVRAGTEDPYLNHKTPEERMKRLHLASVMKRTGVDMTNRGETTFILARKPHAIS